MCLWNVAIIQSAYKRGPFRAAALIEQFWVRDMYVDF